MSSHLNAFLYHFKARTNITVAPHLLYAMHLKIGDFVHNIGPYITSISLIRAGKIKGPCEQISIGCQREYSTQLFL